MRINRLMLMKTKIVNKAKVKRVLLRNQAKRGSDKVREGRFRKRASDTTQRKFFGQFGRYLNRVIGDRRMIGI